MATAAARLAVVGDKQQGALTKALTAWFSAQFVKSGKIQQLRTIHQSGAYAAFAELLNAASDADRVTLLKKVDPHRPEIMTKSQGEMMTHIKGLASGTIQPAPKLKEVKTSKPKAGKAKGPAGIISASKY
jgi:hypothetical protein